MSKKVAKVVKLEIIGGQAKPGSALASAGINMPKFCTEFNAKTQDRAGKDEIKIYRVFSTNEDYIKKIL